ncbi:hypothetical protein A1O3_04109 [Capronia epimyces CBS 606.96]|uniref:DUF1275 domain protein n=1 Tax=Capronia epimyces CBS 606.96 TaxID=1182542 RepID=W9YBV0_9EURO|nr:uncharacterized protein A1O3_04109 [Capronia epimyces CBS 606.96]EXJ87150.1 hypothetical protein A1O3_04109 [Capronia epimyces CBS 606.96]
MARDGRVFEKDPETGSSDVLTRPRPSGLSGYLSQDIRLQHADMILLVCSFISGLCDSGAFNAWSCFVSMQTGNTIFLGLGASGLPVTKPYGWLRSMIAIISFLFGCFSFSLTRNFKPRSRGMLSVSFAVQAILLTVAAVLVQTKVVPDTTDGSESMKVLIPLVFLGFQAGGQVWASEVLGFKEIPTTVLTSVYFGLASDVRFMQGIKTNPSRNRRLGAVCALLLGAISGGWLSRSRAGIPAVFFVAAGLKYVISAMWLIWVASSA